MREAVLVIKTPYRPYQAADGYYYQWFQTAQKVWKNIRSRQPITSDLVVIEPTFMIGIYEEILEDEISGAVPGEAPPVHPQQV